MYLEENRDHFQKASEVLTLFWKLKIVFGASCREQLFISLIYMQAPCQASMAVIICI